MLAQDTQCVQSLCTGRYDALYVQRYGQTTGKCVGFVAAAVSLPMGGCRAIRPVGGRSLVSAETVDVIVAAELAVL